MDPTPESTGTSNHTLTLSRSSRRRRAISNAQRRALRAWFFGQPTAKRSQAEASTWWRQAYGYHLNSSTVSEIVSYKYDVLDKPVAEAASIDLSQRERERKRQRAAKWEDLEEALIEWVFRCETTMGRAVTGNMLRQRAVALWHEMPRYHDSPMPKWSEGWRTRFKARYHVRKLQMLKSCPAEDAGAQPGGGEDDGAGTPCGSDAGVSVSRWLAPSADAFTADFYSSSPSSSSCSGSTPYSPFSQSAMEATGYFDASLLAPSIQALGDGAAGLDPETVSTWPMDASWQNGPLVFGELSDGVSAGMVSSWLFSEGEVEALSMGTSLPLIDSRDCSGS